MKAFLYIRLFVMANAAYRLCNAITAMRRQAYGSLRASARCASVTQPLAEEDKAGVKN